MLHAAVARSSSDHTAICYVFPVSCRRHIFNRLTKGQQRGEIWCLWLPCWVTQSSAVLDIQELHLHDDVCSLCAVRMQSTRCAVTKSDTAKLTAVVSDLSGVLFSTNGRMDGASFSANYPQNSAYTFRRVTKRFGRQINEFSEIVWRSRR